MTYKMIIDTDPGVDDALAIAYAVNHPEIELVGLTTIFGNVSVDQSAANAGYLLDLLEYKRVPVASASVPLQQTPHSFLISFMVKTALATSRLNTLPTSNRII